MSSDFKAILYLDYPHLDQDREITAWARMGIKMLDIFYKMQANQGSFTSQAFLEECLTFALNLEARTGLWPSEVDTIRDLDSRCPLTSKTYWQKNTVKQILNKYDL